MRSAYLAAVCVLALAGGGAQAALFSDDFEDSDLVGWTVEAGSYTRQVTSATAAGGSTYSLTLTGGSNGHYNGVSHALTNLTPSQVNFYVRSGSTTAADGYFVTGVGTGLSSQAVFFYMGQDGTFIVVNGTVFPAYVASQWYLISFVFDWVGRTFDFYVDGGLVEASIPFRRATVDRLSVVHLYNFHNSQAWWDEIEFLPLNAPPTVSITSPTDGK